MSHEKWRAFQQKQKKNDALICFRWKSLLHHQLGFSKRFCVSPWSLGEVHMTWQLECRWMQMSGIVLSPCRENLFFRKNLSLIRQPTENWPHLISKASGSSVASKNPSFLFFAVVAERLLSNAALFEILKHWLRRCSWVSCFDLLPLCSQKKVKHW